MDEDRASSCREGSSRRPGIVHRLVEKVVDRWEEASNRSDSLDAAGVWLA